MAKRKLQALLLTGIGSPDPALEGESIIDIADTAARYIYEFAARVHHICSDKKLDGESKKAFCGLFFNTAYNATKLLLRLAGRFPELFREIAEKSSHFPSLFPAHPEELRYLQKVILNDLNLGKHHTLKLRPARGRKTFSQNTWVNELLLNYLDKVCKGVASKLNEYEAKYDAKELIAKFSKLSITRDNASRWFDIIWTLLLIDIPDPETHPRLRQLGGRPSKVHDVRATIKAKLGIYFERMLNDQAVHK
jgi:hypothetical protein